MTSTTLTPGRGLAEPSSAPTVDKWDILQALTQAAEAFGLSHRTLGVLKALMTFHPGREISALPHAAIVFPANRTLSDRLNGMPESTLRRHLAQLVKLGVVDRRDSPNHKRFARRVGQRIALAFGFDLSPLARAADQIAQAAAERRITAEEIAVARQTLIAVRQTVLDRFGPDAVTEAARLLLRRKADLAELTAMTMDLRDRLTPQPETVTPEKSSGTDNQNERHIQTETKHIPDSEGHERRIALRDVTDACAEYRCYFPHPLRHWAELHEIASRIAPMIGIDPPVLIAARRTLGADAASVVVLCILERLKDIDNPGAYLRSLTQQGRAGGFDVWPMLQAAARRQGGKLSADNFSGQV